MTDTPARAPRWAIWLPLALFLGFVALVMALPSRRAQRRQRAGG